MPSKEQTIDFKKLQYSAFCLCRESGHAFIVLNEKHVKMLNFHLDLFFKILYNGIMCMIIKSNKSILQYMLTNKPFAFRYDRNLNPLYTFLNLTEGQMLFL